MHRSGTSLAARAVNLLGVSFGRSQGLMPAGRDNPAGYWENRDIKELDDAVLTQRGGSWDQPPVLEPGWEHGADLDEHRARAAEILDRDFGEVRATPGLMGWKEPRLCLVLPFWRTVVGIDTTVLVVRDPREVASSLHSRNGMDEAQGALLWLRYLLAAMANDEGHLLVGQQDFSTDLEGTLATMAAHLRLPAPSAEVIEAVRDHIDPSLVHHVARPDEPVPADPVMRLALDVWNGGAVAAGAARLAPAVAEAIRDGWLAPPGSREALARARAEAIELRDRVRVARRAERARLAAEAAALGSAAAAPDEPPGDAPAP
jgi:hypothetical protein